MDNHRLNDDWHYLFFVRPMRQIEERVRGSPQARPVYPCNKVEIGRTEVETSSIENDGAPAFINFP